MEFMVPIFFNDYSYVSCWNFCVDIIIHYFTKLIHNFMCSILSTFFLPKKHSAWTGLIVRRKVSNLRNLYLVHFILLYSTEAYDYYIIFPVIFHYLLYFILYCVQSLHVCTRYKLKNRSASNEGSVTLHLIDLTIIIYKSTY